MLKGSAAKRYRQSLKRRTRNRIIKSGCRTEIKKLVQMIEKNDITGANQQFKEVEKSLDSAARKGTLDKNNVARKKSRLRKKINSLSTEET